MNVKSSAGEALVKIQDPFNDAQCFKVVRELHWPESMLCPHCGDDRVTKCGHDET